MNKYYHADPIGDKGEKAISFSEWIMRLNSEDLIKFLISINKGRSLNYARCPYENDMECNGGPMFVEGKFQKGKCNTCESYKPESELELKDTKTFIDQIRAMNPSELEKYVNENNHQQIKLKLINCENAKKVLRFRIL